MLAIVNVVHNYLAEQTKLRCIAMEDVDLDVYPHVTLVPQGTIIICNITFMLDCIEVTQFVCNEASKIRIARDLIEYANPELFNIIDKLLDTINTRFYRENSTNGAST